MRVYIINFRRINLRAAQSRLHAAVCPVAIFGRCCHMISITRHAVTNHLSINARATGLGVFNDENARLAAALSVRIDRARRDDPDATYRDLIARVLDYRAWHEMSVLVHRPGETPRQLARHPRLSEGEKKVVSYLPLFAAVAASCDALAERAPSAPRFLLLDDAFAKVSEDNHASLFGLLVDLDLDFIVTSERLWGTHASIPELSICEVVRDATMNTILLERAHWNGGAMKRSADRPGKL